MARHAKTSRLIDAALGILREHHPPLRQREQVPCGRPQRRHHPVGAERMDLAALDAVRQAEAADRLRLRQALGA